MHATMELMRPSVRPRIKHLRSIRGNLLDETAVCLGDAKRSLMARNYISVLEKCTAIIDGNSASGKQRMAALMARGKAFHCLDLPVAAAYDFYKVLEMDHNHSEAFESISIIALDYDLPLLKEK